MTCWICDGIGGIFDRVPKFNKELNDVVWVEDFVKCPYCGGTGESDNNFNLGLKNEM